MRTSELQALIVLPLGALIVAIRVRTGHGPRRRQPARARPRRQPTLVTTTTAKVAVSAVVVSALPWLVYLIVRAHVDTAAEALMVASAVPLVWALARCGRRRRVDSASVAVVAAYAVAVALSALLGGSAMTLKLRDVAALAAVGLACLISSAIRRPLLLTGLQMAVRRGGDNAGAVRARLADPATRGDLGAATVLAGGLFLAAAVTDVLLMVTVSTAVFLAIAGPLGGLTPLAAILATIALLRHRSRRRTSIHRS
jgi:hypothetical protein